MAKHRDLNYNDRLPEAVLDALMEFISTYVSPNFDISQANSTTMQVVAGAVDAEVAVGIMGKWRYNSATVTAAHPGGGAGSYDVFVTASDNNFVATGGTPPETDSTVYSFGLQILASGSFPTTALYRKVGVVTWSGTAITDFQSTYGTRRHHQTHEPGGTDAISPTLFAAATTLAGTLGARPAAATANNALTYLATDDNGGTLYRSTGAAWVKMAHSVTSTLVGTLAARPGAGTLSAGYIYLATDANGGSAYRTDGASTWTQIGSGVTHAALHLAGGSDAIAWVTVHGSGTLAARPAFGATNAGYFYFATDSAGGTLFYSTGAAWVAVAAGLTAAPNAHAAAHLAGGTDAIAWTTVQGQGTLAARPAVGATNSGYQYLATDTLGGTVYQSNGASWTQMAAGVTHATVHAPGGADALPWTTIHGIGTLAGRPSAASTNNGYLYYATDNGTLYRSNGATYDTLSASASSIAASILLMGTFAARPAAAAGNTNFMYFATDENGGTLYQSTGAAWLQVGSRPGTLTNPQFAALIYVEGVVPGHGSGDVSTDPQLSLKIGLSANFTVSIQPGYALIQGDDSAQQGLYGAVQAAATTLTFGTTTPATNPRIDAVIARYNDPAFTGRTPTGLVFEQVVGTPTAGANLTNMNGAAAVPASALLLAYVLILPTDTTVIQAGNIQDRRKIAGPAVWGEDSHRYRVGIDSAGALGTELVL